MRKLIHMSRDPKTIATYALSAAMALLGIGLIYFAFVLTKVMFQLPDLIDEIQIVQENLDPVVEEVKSIDTTVQLLIEEVARVREQIPPILAEVEAVRLELVPPVLEETSQIRAMFPSILAETAAYREQIPVIVGEVDDILEQLPAILQQIEDVRLTIDGVRITTEGVIAEVNELQEEIPLMLDRVEDISLNLQTVGEKAGEGAVKGVFTGIIKTPFNVISGVGGVFSNIKDITDEDKALFMENASDLLESGAVGDEADWRNDNTRLRGKIVLLAIEGSGSDRCCRLGISARKASKDLGSGEVVFCRDKDGQWRLSEDRK
jgi:uncharacterized protein YoxC